MVRFGTAFVAIFVCFASPAAAKILYVCGAPTSSEADFVRNVDSRFAEPTRISMTPDGLSEMGQIALLEDENGYDVRLNYGTRDERSLRGEGADILGTGFGVSFVHLMVSPDSDSRTEHFIFTEDHDGLGNLAWGQSPDASGPAPATDGLDRKARCVLP